MRIVQRRRLAHRDLGLAEPDVEHGDGAGEVAAHEQPALEGAEGERQVGAYGEADLVAGGRVESGRYVERHDDAAGRCIARRHAHPFVGEVAGVRERVVAGRRPRAGSEHGVDDQSLGTADRPARAGSPRPVELEARVVGVRRVAAPRHRADPDAEASECRGDHPPVATVVAGAAVDRDAPAKQVRVAADDLARGGRAGALHQRASRRPRGDRRLIGVCGLGGGGDADGRNATAAHAGPSLRRRRPPSRAARQPGRGRRAPGRHLCDGPTARPYPISPLSMRTLNPHSALLHTHALYVIGAPSRP
jgi:hypothetical protein